MNQFNKNEVITVKPNTLRSPGSVSLGINDQRILFYSIYKIQTNATSVSFTKQELDEVFDIDFGSYKDIKNYLFRLRNFGAGFVNEKTQKISIVNAFSTLDYDNGLFTFKFNQDFLPTLNNQKRFLMFGMKSIEKFKCKYSIYLYDYLKDSMWGNISLKKNLSLKEFKDIFQLSEDKYKGRNTNFKSRVWQPAMDEINEYTDYKIQITTKGIGDKITFTIHRLENETINFSKTSSTEIFQCYLGKELIDYNCKDCMKINSCPFKVQDISLNSNEAWKNISFYMEQNFWGNKYYSLPKRIRNNVASDLELAFYDFAIQQAKQFGNLSGEKIDEINVEIALEETKQMYLMTMKGEIVEDDDYY